MCLYLESGNSETKWAWSYNPFVEYAPRGLRPPSRLCCLKVHSTSQCLPWEESLEHFLFSLWGTFNIQIIAYILWEMDRQIKGKIGEGGRQVERKKERRKASDEESMCLYDCFYCHVSVSMED
jgi:hypothetical protein